MDLSLSISIQNDIVDYFALFKDIKIGNVLTIGGALMNMLGQ